MDVYIIMFFLVKILFIQSANCFQIKYQIIKIKYFLKTSRKDINEPLLINPLKPVILSLNWEINGDES